MNGDGPIHPNREQRRRLKLVKTPPTLREYLDQPDLVVRRMEAWKLIGTRIQLEELARLNRRPWRRAIRWMHSLFGGKEATVDPETGEEGDDA